MSSSRSVSVRGFTLLEVMAAVLVLGLLYTVLAGAAMRGLRSEGTDRRRADAELIADRELTTIEAELEAGAALEDGRTELEVEPYQVLIEIAPADVIAMLPASLGREIAKTTDPKAPSLLHDERGESRIWRVSVVVAWDEAGEPDQVERTTFAFDKSALAQFFPSESESPGSEAAATDDPYAELRKDAPPELQELMPGAPAPKAPRRRR